MKGSFLRVIASIAACVLHVACMDLPAGSPAGSGGAGGGECGGSELGEAVSGGGGGPLCECDVDCFLSGCSISTCVDGGCVHEQIEDGTTCLDPDWGYGACESSTCVVDP
jgi:hypothetical protein